VTDATARRRNHFKTFGDSWENWTLPRDTGAGTLGDNWAFILGADIVSQTSGSLWGDFIIGTWSTMGFSTVDTYLGLHLFSTATPAAFIGTLKYTQVSEVDRPVTR
jgi:hypothetical protein